MLIETKKTWIDLIRYIWAGVEPALDPFWGHLFFWIGGGVEPPHTSLLAAVLLHD